MISLDEARAIALAAVEESGVEAAYAALALLAEARALAVADGALKPLAKRLAEGVEPERVRITEIPGGWRVRVDPAVNSKGGVS